MRFSLPSRLDREEWHDWFAWHPVRILSGEYVWLETVLRKGRRELYANGDGQPVCGWSWDYQA